MNSSTTAGDSSARFTRMECVPSQCVVRSMSPLWDTAPARGAARPLLDRARARIDARSAQAASCYPCRYLQMPSIRLTSALLRHAYTLLSMQGLRAGPTESAGRAGGHRSLCAAHPQRSAAATGWAGAHRARRPCRWTCSGYG